MILEKTTVENILTFVKDRAEDVKYVVYALYRQGEDSPCYVSEEKAETFSEKLRASFGRYMCAIDSLHTSKSSANAREQELIKEHGKDKTVKPAPEPMIKEASAASERCRVAAFKAWAKRKR